MMSDMLDMIKKYKMNTHFHIKFSVQYETFLSDSSSYVSIIYVFYSYSITVFILKIFNLHYFYLCIAFACIIYIGE